MLMTFGILALFVGGVLLVISLPRLLLARNTGATTAHPYGAKLLIASVLVLCSSVFMIHEGHARAENGVDLGILMFFGGLVITVLGTWLGFWGPLSSRNTTKGLQFILIGLMVMTVGILAVTDSGLPFLSGVNPRSPQLNRINWDNVFSHRMGAVPFGLFCLAVIVGANGVALNNKLSAGKFMGVNCIIVAMLIITYALGPKLFTSW